MSETARLLVADRSSVGAARAETRRLCTVAGFDEHATSEALIVASELATNLVLHAGSGSFHLCARPGTMTLATWDAGPGILDVARAFEDGFSTAGTAGAGLGAVRRLAASMHLRSSRARGTVVVAELGAPGPPAAEGFEVGGVTLPLSGSGPCGDAFAVRRHGDAMTLVLADGLGHGPHAAEAADRALACLFDGAEREPAALLEAMGGALRRTRGAAVAVARLEPGRRQVRFAGVGNVAGLVASPLGRRTLAGSNGIVGREQRHAPETTYPLQPGDTVVLHTDGVREGWDPAGDRGILREDPRVVAAAIVRDHERGRDDVGVAVVRQARP